MANVVLIFQTLAGLNELRQSTTLCDVNVVVGEHQLPVHKCVLAACSNYFKVGSYTSYVGPGKRQLFHGLEKSYLRAESSLKSFIRTPD